MPIRPENRKLYPKNWKEIRKKILERAGNCCEFCGVKNHAEGVRGNDGEFIEFGEGAIENQRFDGLQDLHIIKIVLTIAHLDHDPTNNDPHNLRALCQRCHNIYDMEHRLQTRKQTRKLKEIIKNENE